MAGEMLKDFTERVYGKMNNRDIPYGNEYFSWNPFDKTNHDAGRLFISNVTDFSKGGTGWDAMGLGLNTAGNFVQNKDLNNAQKIAYGDPNSNPFLTLAGNVLGKDKNIANYNNNVINGASNFYDVNNNMSVGDALDSSKMYSNDYGLTTKLKNKNVFSSALKGASTGSKYGLWGTAVGAIAGGAAGVVNNILGDKNNTLMLYARDAANNILLENSSWKMNDNNKTNIRSSFLTDMRAFGGNINTRNMNRFLQGGNISNYNNGVTYFGNGGTHELNKLGGIPLGYAPDGQPNLVEEGEVKYDDYIFSERLKCPKEILEQFDLPKRYAGKSFAYIATKLLEESEKRPNDKISISALLMNMNKLLMALETFKDLKGKQDKAELMRNLSDEELSNMYDSYNQQGRYEQLNNNPLSSDEALFNSVLLSYLNGVNPNLLQLGFLQELYSNNSDLNLLNQVMQSMSGQPQNSYQQQSMSVGGNLRYNSLYNRLYGFGGHKFDGTTNATSLMTLTPSYKWTNEALDFATKMGKTEYSDESFETLNLDLANIMTLLYYKYREANENNPTAVWQGSSKQNSYLRSVEAIKGFYDFINDYNDNGSFTVGDKTYTKEQIDAARRLAYALKGKWGYNYEGFSLYDHRNQGSKVDNAWISHLNDEDKAAVNTLTGIHTGAYGTDNAVGPRHMFALMTREKVTPPSVDTGTGATPDDEEVVVPTPEDPEPKQKPKRFVPDPQIPFKPDYWSSLAGLSAMGDPYLVTPTYNGYRAGYRPIQRQDWTPQNKYYDEARYMSNANGYQATSLAGTSNYGARTNARELALNHIPEYITANENKVEKLNILNRQHANDVNIDASKTEASLAGEADRVNASIANANQEMQYKYDNENAQTLATMASLRGKSILGLIASNAANRNAYNIARMQSEMYGRPGHYEDTTNDDGGSSTKQEPKELFGYVHYSLLNPLTFNYVTGRWGDKVAGTNNNGGSSTKQEPKELSGTNNNYAQGGHLYLNGDLMPVDESTKRFISQMVPIAGIEGTPSYLIPYLLGMDPENMVYFGKTFDPVEVTERALDKNRKSNGVPYTQEELYYINRIRERKDYKGLLHFMTAAAFAPVAAIGVGALGGLGTVGRTALDYSRFLMPGTWVDAAGNALGVPITSSLLGSATVGDAVNAGVMAEMAVEAARNAADKSNYGNNGRYDLTLPGIANTALDALALTPLAGATREGISLAGQGARAVGNYARLFGSRAVNYASGLGEEVNNTINAAKETAARMRKQVNNFGSGYPIFATEGYPTRVSASQAGSTNGRTMNFNLNEPVFGRNKSTYGSTIPEITFYDPTAGADETLKLKSIIENSGEIETQREYFELMKLIDDEMEKYNKMIQTAKTHKGDNKALDGVFDMSGAEKALNELREVKKEINDAFGNLYGIHEVNEAEIKSLIDYQKAIERGEKRDEIVYSDDIAIDLDNFLDGSSSTIKRESQISKYFENEEVKLTDQINEYNKKIKELNDQIKTYVNSKGNVIKTKASAKKEAEDKVEQLKERKKETKSQIDNLHKDKEALARFAGTLQERIKSANKNAELAVLKSNPLEAVKGMINSRKLKELTNLGNEKVSFRTDNSGHKVSESFTEYFKNKKGEVMNRIEEAESSINAMKDEAKKTELLNDLTYYKELLEKGITIKEGSFEFIGSSRLSIKDVPKMVNNEFKNINKQIDDIISDLNVEPVAPLPADKQRTFWDEVIRGFGNPLSGLKDWRFPEGWHIPKGSLWLIPYLGGVGSSIIHDVNASLDDQNKYPFWHAITPILNYFTFNKKGPAEGEAQTTPDINYNNDGAINDRNVANKVDSILNITLE